MKRYGNFILAALCCALGLCWVAAVSAPIVEASTVSTEEVAVSFESTVPAESVESTADSDSAGVGADVAVATESSADSSLSDLSFYDISSSLGDIRLYLPSGFDVSTLQVVDGYLFNTSNSTVYLYCPEYPDYTFSASRWGNVQYRVSSNYSNVELTDVTINSSSTYYDWIRLLIVFCLVLGVCILYFKR